MVFFFSWLFGITQDTKEDVKYFSKAVSFKIAVHDFGKFDGKPEHWYVFMNKKNDCMRVSCQHIGAQQYNEAWSKLNQLLVETLTYLIKKSVILDSNNVDDECCTVI